MGPVTGDTCSNGSAGDCLGCLAKVVAAATQAVREKGCCGDMVRVLQG